MLNALTRGVSASIANCELTHLPRTPIDLELARQQHHAYEDLLRDLGVRVTSLPPMESFPDAVFVEDAAVVLDEVLVPARMGTASRAGEVFSVAEELAFHRRVLSLPPSGTLEGGDVVRVGKKLYVGITRRTSQAGVEGLRSILMPYGYEVIDVRVTGCLHLKSGCSYLGRNMMLMNSSWVDSRQFRGFEIIEVPSNERGGANVLVVAETLVIPKSFPATRQLLERRGFRTKAIDISELLKAEAGVTCESIIFESDKAGPTKGLR